MPGGLRNVPPVPPSPANCCALIPCREEAKFIGEVVRAVRRLLPGVVVIDDGSRDDTAGVAAAAGATVLCHGASQGKGAALATGWAWAQARDFRWVMMLDGDGQHAAEDIPAFFAAAGDTTLVLGNRMAQASVMPWLRRAANQWLSARISGLAGLPIPDSQCGFRLAHLPTLLALAPDSRHFEIESELCVRFARAGQRIVSVPVQVRYAGERSKISPFRDYGRWCRWYLRARWENSRSLGH